MNVDELQAGRELDALVAEKVMGWEKLNVEYFSTPECSDRQIELREWMDKVGLNSVGTYFIDVPRNFWIEIWDWSPSASIKYAWQVVENVLVLYPDVYPILEQFHIKDRREWNCVFWNGEDKSFSAHAVTAPIAICRAALKAVINDTVETVPNDTTNQPKT